MLRDDKGMVLMHIRRSFTNIPSLKEAHRSVWIWSIESMRSLGFSKIVCAGETKELVGAVIRPPAWPSFKWMSKAKCTQLERVDRKLIWGAYRIVLSVVLWDISRGHKLPFLARRSFWIILWKVFVVCCLLFIVLPVIDLDRHFSVYGM